MGLEGRGPVYRVTRTQTPSPRPFEGTMVSLLCFVGRTQATEGTLVVKCLPGCPCEWESEREQEGRAGRPARSRSDDRLAGPRQGCRRTVDGAEQATEIDLEVPSWWGAGRRRGPRPPVESDLKKTGSCGSGAFNASSNKNKHSGCPSQGCWWAAGSACRTTAQTRPN